jgi:hypothetical protein
MKGAYKVLVCAWCGGRVLEGDDHCRVHPRSLTKLLTGREADDFIRDPAGWQRHNSLLIKKEQEAKKINGHSI